MKKVLFSIAFILVFFSCQQEPDIVLACDEPDEVDRVAHTIKYEIISPNAGSALISVINETGGLSQYWAPVSPSWTYTITKYTNELVSITISNSTSLDVTASIYIEDVLFTYAFLNVIGTSGLASASGYIP